ncbi:MAG: hypothetical protein ACLQBL_19605 [Polyangiaceae bacterium]
MSILLTTERGDVLDEVGDPTNHLHRVLPAGEDAGYVLVNFIDWYGDTIFNRLQMSRFLAEWAMLREAARADGGMDLHAKVAAMAERCSAEVHLYLKFRGD